MHNVNKIKTNRFTYEAIMDSFNIVSYDELKIVVDEMIENNKIKPIKSKGMTSFFPKIYCEYRKVTEKKDYTELKNEILKLNPRLNISRYLNNPELYEELREQILKLSNFLWNKKESLNNEMSVKERSFEIWGDEKFLESKEGKSILTFNKFDNEYLNFYYAPEPFFCTEIKKKNKDANVLVIENKDTWYSIGKALNSSEKKLLYNIEINYLIYGEGNKVTRKNALTDFINVISDSPRNIYYAGDIDVAGINMLYNCDSNNECTIVPFMPLYKNMVLTVEVDKMNKTDDNRGKDYNKEFLAEFNESEKMMVREILDSNKRIPQEILSYQDYINAVQ
ncbi:MAG: DUF2220 family protein [Sedimentibacter sp.]|uniref:Wadjet anti-phage system protein JetD domain-containing protein n=1 Tax=Sedimentibacter sp. TaxID=1960295 RepID=UPI00298245BD|nr:Wadjet anti-phage system protein JetD domain-containing protein [Sedimentibacter sp.]MDW5298527.1 DUF2220 family protein [Sedimentibacter sp.]